MYRFDGQTILITGATGGIGSAAALRFAAAGGKILLHCNKNVDAAKKISEKINSSGGIAEIFVADFHKQSDLDKFLFDVTEKYFQIDILINAAGIDLMSIDLVQDSFDERLKKIFSIDVFATIAVTRRVCELMKKQGKGKIFFFGWDGVEFGWQGETAQLYGAAKGAIQGFARSLAETVAPKIQIRTLALGWIKTNWGKSAEKFNRRVELDSLAERWGEPDEIADIILFLASNNANYIDCTNLKLNGVKRNTKNYNQQ
ncbi:MAG: SDR family oxidoreductase [Planctomycetaceae bacterium]|nr:SDR family oxidoreductase [Planctomycetaceae bacterium]